MAKLEIFDENRVPGHLHRAIATDGSASGRVLVVDDDQATLSALCEALATLGHQVWRATSGEDALEAAAQHLPDLILLDIRLPGIDGYETCRRLKRDPDLRLIPVIILSAEHGRVARLAGLEAGAADFLCKPCELTELKLRVRNLVSFRHLTRELDSAEEMVFTIARTIEARDEDTGDHCGRLARLSVRLGQHLGLPAPDLKSLYRGAYLHDIGKVGIPDAVLLKPGRLDEQEWTVMRRHPEIGAGICAPVRTLRPVLPIIRHHHERYDGTGYPDGLAGQEILYLARVFQVVDVYDALANDRCYRRALSPEQALATIEQETRRGWHDPGVVAVFTAMIASSLAVLEPPLESTGSA